MKPPRTWMVRCDGGALYEHFKEQGVAAIGWRELAQVPLDAPKSVWLSTFTAARPDLKPGTVQSGVSQVLRFVNDVAPGDLVVTYDPSTRRYLLGRFGEGLRRNPSDPSGSLVYIRPAAWEREVDRDALSTATKNTLGSTLTFFLVGQSATDELLNGRPRQAEQGTVDTASNSVEEGEAKTALLDIESRAIEFIKDKLAQIDGYLIEHYEHIDVEIKQLVPLRRLYWPM
ncbi:restriction endonuclease [Aquabacterium sp. J223]|uniref:restriction endonuclease n=1 Tax=Aquabacterium sp. J223 TaxID=2898431 RepID=UPI0021AD77B5|nr:hypothetical protein [Aquabacterium sp. J223]UUX95921.1 hypothetical protein LRS07_00785 [Aquabacterium sp. J223]